MDNERIGSSGKLISHYLKDVFEPARIVDINVDKAFFHFHEERGFKVSMVFASFEAPGIFETCELRWKMM